MEGLDMVQAWDGMDGQKQILWKTITAEQIGHVKGLLYSETLKTLLTIAVHGQIMSFSSLICIPEGIESKNRQVEKTLEKTETPPVHLLAHHHHKNM